MNPVGDSILTLFAEWAALCCGVPQPDSAVSRSGRVLSNQTRTIPADASSRVSSNAITACSHEPRLRLVQKHQVIARTTSPPSSGMSAGPLMWGPR
jgi:hypothetical protein